jgi:hypothetical protein
MSQKINFIFCNLPFDIKKYILLYDKHFIMRKGQVISIIPKTDYRYILLKFITFNLESLEIYNNQLKYKYYFPNLYNYEGRQMNNSDLIQVNINENNDFIKYSIWIGKQYPKSIDCNKKQNYYIENLLDYNWIYTEYEYIRK